MARRWLATLLTLLISGGAHAATILETREDFTTAQLSGAKLPRSNGHVLLLRGFTKSGDPMTNDPAGKTESAKDIVTVYDRAEFERAWIEHSGGVVYVIGP